MRKLIVFMETGYAGMDGTEFIEVPETFSDEEIDEIAWSLARDHAGTYGLYDAECEDYDEHEELEETYTDVSASWEDYEPEKHDMYRVGNEDTAWYTFN